MPRTPGTAWSCAQAAGASVASAAAPSAAAVRASRRVSILPPPSGVVDPFRRSSSRAFHGSTGQFAARGCIDPIFLPKIAIAGQEFREIGLKDRIVSAKGEQLSGTSTIVTPGSARHPLPDLALARRVGCDAHRSRLLGRLRRSAHRRGRRARGPRPDVHERARHRGVRGGDPRARAARRRAHARGDRRRHARLLAQPHLRHAAALARPREGRHPPRDGRGRQRRLGSLGQARGQAALEAARRTSRPSSSSGASTSATSRTRSRPRRRSSCCATRAAGARQREREIVASGYPGVHDVGGLARLRRRQGGVARAARRSPRASRT